MRLWVAIVALFCAAHLFARDNIAAIEFFGYQGIDVEAVRAALPFHAGDKLPENIKSVANTAVKRVTGRGATNVGLVCCLGDGDTAVFIGLPGTSSRAPQFNPAPKGEAVIPPEWADLQRKMDEAQDAALQKGQSEEDLGAGYRLSKEPVTRAAQLAFREYALKHEDEIIHILETSSHSDQRAQAADALGYSARTPRQMKALLNAVKDPNNTVRNQSIRAIGEILEADRGAASDIPPDPFIALVCSGVWTDRNKASWVLEKLTESRDAKLLAKLKADAWDPLLEMARWSTIGWAAEPRKVLGRIAGIPEERLNALEFGTAAEFLAAIKP